MNIFLRLRRQRDAEVAGATFQGVMDCLVDLGYLKVPEGLDMDMLGEVLGRAAAQAVQELDA